MYYINLADKETEAWKSWVICQGHTTHKCQSHSYLHSVRTIPQLGFLMLACFLIVTSIFQMYIDVAIINKV